jgi:hypothetical protein
MVGRARSERASLPKFVMRFVLFGLRPRVPGPTIAWCIDHTPARERGMDEARSQSFMNESKIVTEPERFGDSGVWSANERRNFAPRHDRRSDQPSILESSSSDTSKSA